MTKLFIGYDILGSTSTGLGTKHSGGGNIEIYDDLTSISSGTPSSTTPTGGDFSNGIAYNSDTGQWIGGVNGEAFYVYDSLEAMSANQPSQAIPYVNNGLNYNNGIAYKADTNTYVGAFSVPSTNQLYVVEFASLQDMANYTNQIETYVGTGNYNNGIDYDAETGEWFGAYNGGTAPGAIVTFSSLDDLLAYKPKSVSNFASGVHDYEMGIAVMPCFASGTLIETANGQVAVEDLARGDMVKTLDHGHQPIRWIGMRALTAEELAQNPDLRPIQISAGALAPNVPASDLTVSPQHRVLIRSKIAQRMFGTNEVLVAAKHLLELDGVEIIEDAPGVEYFHILFDEHQVVFSNGAQTESLYTGEQALEGVGPAARKEIFELFPELEARNADVDSARQLVPGRVGRKLINRHVKNARDLITV